jgi:hypothetical protein
MARTYTTRNEAIRREIIEAIESDGAHSDQYDIDAIADRVLGDYEEGYALTVGIDEFWGIVAENKI